MENGLKGSIYLGMSPEKRKRVEQIEERLVTIDDTMTPLFEEQGKLNDELHRLRIEDYINSKVLSQVKWEFEYEQSRDRVVLLSKEKHYEPKSVWKPLEKMSIMGYHESFEVSDRAEIRIDDGELRLIFSTLNEFRKCVADWKLNVDFSKLEQMVNSTRQTLKDLTELLIYVRVK